MVTRNRLGGVSARVRPCRVAGPDLKRECTTDRVNAAVHRVSAAAADPLTVTTATESPETNTSCSSVVGLIRLTSAPDPSCQSIDETKQYGSLIHLRIAACGKGWPWRWLPSRWELGPGCSAHSARLAEPVRGVDAGECDGVGAHVGIPGRPQAGAHRTRGDVVPEFRFTGMVAPAGYGGRHDSFWSPDSRDVAFTVDKLLKRVDTTGGPPETLATVPTSAARSGTWNGRGDIVLGSWGGGSGGPLWRVSAGGVATAVTQVDVSKGEFVHTWPTFLPDGTHFLYFRSGPPDVEGMYVGSLEADAANQSRQRILATGVPAVFANGYIFFLRAGTLMAQPFDHRRLELQGEPVPVAQDVQITWYSTGVFSVSGNGVLAYRAASASRTFQLAWYDRQGKNLGTFGPPGTDRRVVMSPDGTRGVVKDTPYSVPGDLWTLDFASGRLTRLTFKKEAYSPGVWSPDGARIAYSAGHLGDTLYEKAASGLGDARVLFSKPGLRHFPTSWSRDGRFLLYHTENAPRTGYDLWALSLRDGKPHLMLGEAFNEWAGVFSPDMRWVAYVSLETGPAAQVYVRPFLVSGQTGQPSLGEGKWQVSKDQGNWPEWRVEGEIVFNTAPSGTAAFAAPVNTSGTAFESGVPQRLSLPPSIDVVSTPQSSPDGQRFLVEMTQDQRAPRTSISVVLNWPALLKQ